MSIKIVYNGKVIIGEFEDFYDLAEWFSGYYNWTGYAVTMCKHRIDGFIAEVKRLINGDTVSFEWHHITPKQEYVRAMELMEEIIYNDLHVGDMLDIEVDIEYWR